MIRSILRAVATLVVGVLLVAAIMGGVPGLDDLSARLDDTSTATGGDQPLDRDTVDPGPARTVTDRPSSTPSVHNPWGRDRVVVGVRSAVDTDRNITAVVADALDYWRSNRRYAAYAVNFTIRPGAAEPDILVWYNASVDCDYHSEAVGCAPLLSVDSRVPDTVRVQLRHNETRNRRQVLVTAIHEFGHVLGRTHCDPPHWVMGSGCESGIPDGPDVDERELAWRDSNLTVYVDYSGVSPGNLEATKEQVGHALRYYESGEAENFPGTVRFIDVDERWLADITIEIGEASRCDPTVPACSYRYGRDYDRDGRFEYFTRTGIFLRDEIDVEARGWYVGSALAYQLAPGYVPPVFQDADYRERRSAWWE